MLLKNYMEDAVKNSLDKFLSEREDICKCERCKLDITAYALNHLPPKYVVTDIGHTYTRLAEMEQQFSTNLIVVFSRAADQIAKNPRHKV